MDIETLALAKAYTKASLAGAGAVKGEKGDTGEAGKDGVSPTVASTGSAESGEVAGTITDAGGNVISVYNGAKGEKGDKGAQGEKGADGAAGTNGTDGKDGADGTSPEVTITETDGGRILAVTDAGGKKSTFIKDGTDAGDVPTKTSDLANDSGFITQATSALENYYLKSQLYTQDEINNLVSGLGKLKSSIVTALPTENIDTSTIYLIQDSGDTSSYTQWMYINSAWAELGSTSVDLSSYYTKTQADTLLKAKADTTAVPTKTSELSNDAGFLDAGGVDSRVSDKMADYLKIETAASLLDAKADASAVYTKTEADTLLGKKVDAADGKGLSANDLTDELKTAYDKAVTDGHTHSNKDVLDTVTADVVSSSHTHANKDALDTLTADDITQIGTNKTDIAALQDTVSGLIDDTEAGTSKTYSSSKITDLLRLKTLATGYDLNTDDLATGDYSVLNGENAPQSGWGLLEHKRFDNNANYVTQIYHAISSDEIFIRYSTLGNGTKTWSSWRKLAYHSISNGNGTFVSDYLDTSKGAIEYVQSGNVVQVTAAPIYPKESSGTTNIIVTGLPKARGMAFFMFNHGTTFLSAQINRDGTVQLNTPVTSALAGLDFYGTVTYIAE